MSIIVCESFTYKFTLSLLDSDHVLRKFIGENNIANFTEEIGLKISIYNNKNDKIERFCNIFLWKRQIIRFGYSKGVGIININENIDNLSFLIRIIDSGTTKKNDFVNIEENTDYFKISIVNKPLLVIYFSNDDVELDDIIDTSIRNSLIDRKGYNLENIVNNSNNKMMLNVYQYTKDLEDRCKYLENKYIELNNRKKVKYYGARLFVIIILILCISLGCVALVKCY